MAPPRSKVTIRLRPEQHNRIAECARSVGMTINDYMVTCSLARQTDNENMAQLRALLAEQTRSQVAAIDSGFGELVDSLDERNKHASASIDAANEKQFELIKRSLQELVAWFKANGVATPKGGAK